MTEVTSLAPVSRLRQRLIEDMNLRHFSMETQRNYTRDIGRFATYLGRPPDTATAEDLQRASRCDRSQRLLKREVTSCPIFESHAIASRGVAWTPIMRGIERRRRGW